MSIVIGGSSHSISCCCCCFFILYSIGDEFCWVYFSPFYAFSGVIQLFILFLSGSVIRTKLYKKSVCSSCSAMSMRWWWYTWLRGRWVSDTYLWRECFCGMETKALTSTAPVTCFLMSSMYWKPASRSMLFSSIHVEKRSSVDRMALTEGCIDMFS